jgi:hypothetical protein
VVKLSEVVSAAGKAKSAYYRRHFKEPRKLLISAEADTAARSELKRQAVRVRDDDALRQMILHPGEPMKLHGIDVEVSEPLRGAEVEAI